MDKIGRRFEEVKKHFDNKISQNKPVTERTVNDKIENALRQGKRLAYMDSYNQVLQAMKDVEVV